MSKLLYAGMRRYLHSAVFWTLFAANLFLAFHAAINARNFMLDDVFVIAEFIVFAVMITLLVGREMDEGIIRNKIICGHSRTQIYFSEIILSVFAVSVMFLIFAGIFTWFNSYVFTKASISATVKIFFDVWLVNISFALIFTALSLLIPKRVIVAFVNLLLVLGIIFASYMLENQLMQEEFWEFCEYEAVIETDENGNTHIQSVPIEGTEYLEKNPHYIGGILRDVMDVVYKASPYGHITEYLNLTLDWFGYRYYELYSDEEMTWENSDKILSVSKKQMSNINEALVWSASFNLVTLLLGYLIFRKKEFK